jgi:hypothetical protein
VCSEFVDEEAATSDRQLYDKLAKNQTLAGSRCLRDFG